MSWLTELLDPGIRKLKARLAALRKHTKLTVDFDVISSDSKRKLAVDLIIDLRLEIDGAAIDALLRTAKPDPDTISKLEELTRLHLPSEWQ